ncbi:MAG: DUF2088 domain-containing protein [Spirochaetales bacterium]|nr:DUF2088 domain-containing protein [Spirochaetales bacterium]
MSVVSSLLADVPLPKVCPVRQKFDVTAIDDPARECRLKLEEKGVLDNVEKGMTVAVTVGSRGIENLPLFVKCTVEAIKSRGGKPFLFPAMGSHGGATAEGQRLMLEGMGVTEASAGAPIRSTMEVVKIGTSSVGLPVHLDRYASEADGIVVINRVKPHVSFRGRYESGIMKMLAIGAGKQKGAETCHDAGFGSMAENIESIGRAFLANANVLWALALLENSKHKTSRIEVLRADEIAGKEPALQEEAKRLSAKLYFDQLDVLIIDEIGKDIGGTGLDTNVVGRYTTPYITGGPDITRIATLDLTERSHGNANGVGIVDFTTRRLFDKMDFEQTYPNSLTSTVPATVKLPMVLHNDREAIQAAIKTCNIADKKAVRLVRCKNTNSLERIFVSEALLDEVSASGNLEIDGTPTAMQFNAEGNLF